MLDYLKNKKSIYGKEINDILKTISYRYIDNNSPCEFYAMPSIKNKFRQYPDGMFDIDFNALYPEAKNESYAYALTYIYSSEDMQITVGVELSSGGSIWINGECIAKTSVDDENIRKKKKILINVNKGKNAVLIKAQKTQLGFGVKFGEACIAWKPMYLYMPFKDYDGYLGIAYSKVFEKDIYINPQEFPDIEGKMPEEFIFQEKENRNVFNEDGFVYAASSVKALKEAESVFNFNTSDNAVIYINSEKVGEGIGKFSVSSFLREGENSIVAELEHKKDKKFEFSCEAVVDGKKECFLKDRYILSDCKWLYMGVLDEKNPSALNYKNIHTPVEIKNEYWRAGVSENYIRLLRENDIYGKWTYPIGVVLYGLISAAKYLPDNDIIEYVIGHLKKIVDNQPYADFDMKLNGIPSINRQISCLGMLDYCGSSGNALLEAVKYADDKEAFINIAHRIADYIENGQERLENGMFYREREDSIIDYKTIWADDLYMSIPFLCRYYKLTNEKKYLDDAVNQVLCFKEKLYMADKGCMSHVYNLICNKKTCVPWGRGNGWPIVALTELLEVLPSEHKSYNEVFEFYMDFCEGILKLQDENGMWHQVLTHKDSYCETSCTAMFTYGFARGFLRGRLDEHFKEAAIRGFEGICREAVDEDGNVYGVCCGSAYSFRADYYKYELPWIKNDTHGTGIVLLAGVEVAKLIKERG